MFKRENMEGRSIARLRDIITDELVGFLILWETGEINPLWLGDCDLEVVVSWLPGEEIDGFDLTSL